MKGKELDEMVLGRRALLRTGLAGAAGLILPGCVGTTRAPPTYRAEAVGYMEDPQVRIFKDGWGKTVNLDHLIGKHPKFPCDTYFVNKVEQAEFNGKPTTVVTFNLANNNEHGRPSSIYGLSGVALIDSKRSIPSTKQCSPLATLTD